MRRAVLFGGGGFAIELADLLRSCDWDIIGCVAPASCANALPAPWLGALDGGAALPEDGELFFAVGDPDLRRQVAAAISVTGRQWTSFVHPTAWLAPSVVLGNGCIVYPHSTLHARVRLGDCVLVNSNVTIGHETVIGGFASINPGAAIAGKVSVGAGASIGIGASVRERVVIADGVVVGAGAAVVGDLTEAGTYGGVPARRLRSP